MVKVLLHVYISLVTKKTSDSSKCWEPSGRLSPSQYSQIHVCTQTKPFHLQGQQQRWKRSCLPLCTCTCTVGRWLAPHLNWMKNTNHSGTQYMYMWTTGRTHDIHCTLKMLVVVCYMCRSILQSLLLKSTNELHVHVYKQFLLNFSLY